MKASFDYSPLKAALDKLSVYDCWSLLGLEGTPAASCRSPFRKDKNPSFAIYDHGRRWKDHAAGEGGDAANFCARARGLSREGGARLLIELAGTKTEPTPGNHEATWRVKSHLGSGKPQPYDPFKDEVKAAKRALWPAFEVPARAEIEKIAKLRGISPQGVGLAAEMGLLFCADSRDGRAWLITDSRRVSAQARRLDGQRIGAPKARSLPGSIGTWPIGLREARDFPAVALLEGGPDLLAAFHLAWCAGREKIITPVAILGASNRIPEGALPLFAGKQVRIFPHMDAHGKKAGERWAGQLQAAGVAVDGYSFEGLLHADGSSVGDLNDFVHVCSDQWETDQLLIEEAFLFGPEPPETSTRPDPHKETDDGRPF